MDSIGGRNGLAFGNAGNQRSLLLRGYANQVATAIRLLREVDKPQGEDSTSSYYEQLQAYSRLARQHTNAMKAMKKRLDDLEAQFAAVAVARFQLNPMATVGTNSNSSQ